MSKRKLNDYLKGLTKRQLEEQVKDLYSRFKDVKTYYDFAFNPKEDKILEECRFKISKEYYPIGRRKAKLRRSVAQKLIKKYRVLEIDAQVIGEIMLFNIEIAQTYCAEKGIKQDTFYVSMLKSFKDALIFIEANGLFKDFEIRIKKIVEEAIDQEWFNWSGFEQELDAYFN
jgi:hypothetical protein